MFDVLSRYVYAGRDKELGDWFVSILWLQIGVRVNSSSRRIHYFMREPHSIPRRIYCFWLWRVYMMVSFRID